jgi:hypothetical protein
VKVINQGYTEEKDMLGLECILSPQVFAELDQNLRAML